MPTQATTFHYSKYHTSYTFCKYKISYLEIKAGLALFFNEVIEAQSNTSISSSNTSAVNGDANDYAAIV